MRKVIAILLMLALLAGVLLMWRSGHAFSLTAGASSASVSAQLVGQADTTNANTCFCVTGKPTVSATFINQVLAFYHSPARGLGTTIYAQGVKYGINPIYALAFFMHESTFGTQGIARSTLSPGNIKCSAGYRCINGYRAYGSWASGFADWYLTIRSLYIEKLHLSTVGQIIPTYAPAGDHNNVGAYIRAISIAVSSWQAGNVEVQQ